MIYKPLDGRRWYVGPASAEKNMQMCNPCRYGRLSGNKPILAKRVASEKLRVVGAVYDLAKGKVSLVQ